MKIVSAWLILKNGSNSRKVALQQRAEKEEDKIQSFAFVFQATVSGKIEDGETPKQALARETAEELGPNFTLPQLTEFYIAKYKINKKLCVSYNYYGQILKKDLQNIALHSGALPQLYFVGKNDLPKIKTTEDKLANPKNDIVLFPDQLDALKKLFKIV